MIKPGFLIFNERGLYCAAGDFYLDPRQPVNRAVISHAHGDHACASNQTVYCTPATAAIMQLRLKKNAGENFLTYPYRTSFNLNGVHLTFYPAGHILGSAMILMEYQGTRYLYTGDFKLQEDPTCEAAELVSCDVLITETTFADPAVVHPDPKEEIQKLNQTKFNVLLGAYSLGKAQRLTQLISTHCPDRRVFLHHSMLAITRIYEEYAYSPGEYEAYNRKLMKQPDQGFVYIVPPLTFDSYFRAKGVLRAFASGWRRLQAKNDLELLISDHADWNDILKTIDRVKPTEIWTLHGDGVHLKHYFSGSLPVTVLNECGRLLSE